LKKKQAILPQAFWIQATKMLEAEQFLSSSLSFFQKLMEK